MSRMNQMTICDLDEVLRLLDHNRPPLDEAAE
jgi:hypothetical protein